MVYVRNTQGNPNTRDDLADLARVISTSPKSQGHNSISMPFYLFIITSSRTTVHTKKSNYEFPLEMTRTSKMIGHLRHITDITTRSHLANRKQPTEPTIPANIPVPFCATMLLHTYSNPV